MTEVSSTAGIRGVARWAAWYDLLLTLITLGREGTLRKRLVLITPNGANVDNPTTLEPLGGGRFRFVAPTGGGVVGEVVRFVEQAGRPMRMYTGDSWIDRVREP